jgi:hypothetical protein
MCCLTKAVKKKFNNLIPRIAGFFLSLGKGFVILSVFFGWNLMRVLIKKYPKMELISGRAYIQGD